MYHLNMSSVQMKAVEKALDAWALADAAVLKATKGNRSVLVAHRDACADDVLKAQSALAAVAV